MGFYIARLHPGRGTEYFKGIIPLYGVWVRNVSFNWEEAPAGLYQIHYTYDNGEGEVRDIANTATARPEQGKCVRSKQLIPNAVYSSYIFEINTCSSISKINGKKVVTMRMTESLAKIPGSH